MQMHRHLKCLLLLVVYILALAIPVSASTYMEYEDLEVTITTDQDSYEYGEPITATITVTNTGHQSVNVVNLEQLIPDGYVLSENSTAAKSDFEIKPGETVVLEVTMEGTPVEPEEGEEEETGFFDKLLYGETWGISNLLLAVIALIVFGIYMFLT